MAIQIEDVIKLLLALALGGMIGVEREVRDKAAGFRTLMFISAGAALFTIFSIRMAQTAGGVFAGDPGRVAAQIVSGIGFLGAGVILREHGEIRGLTTAATVWLVAALGMGVGAGQYLLSVLATLIILLALLIFPPLEIIIGRFGQERTYTVVIPASHEKYYSLVNLFRQMNLTIKSSKRNQQGGILTCTWMVSGRPKDHETIIELLMDDPEIQEFSV